MSIAKIYLGEVIRAFNGKTPSQGEQRTFGMPVLKIKDITENGEFSGKFESYVESTLYNKYLEKVIKDRDILVLNAAHSSKHVGSKIYIANNEVEGSLATGEWMILRVINGLVPEYLYYWLCLNHTKKKIQSIVKGIHLYPKDVLNLQLALPPTKIQLRIASILKNADDLRRKDQRLLKKYDALLQSIFFQMFGDPIKNEKGWEVQKITQLVKKDKYAIKRGPFGGHLKKEIFVSSGYLVYEQFHALNNDFSFGRYFIDEKRFNELKAFEVLPEDIIISCSGIYLGKLAIVPKDSRKGIINQALLKISLDQSKMRNEFFIHLFSHKSFRSNFFGETRGSGIPNFPPMEDFKQFDFINPPIILQNRFAEIMIGINKQKNQAVSQRRHSESLFQSLLQKAFKGELVI